MATRFRCAFINYQSRHYNIYLDDADYVGSVIDFDSGADGFTLDYQGDQKGLTIKNLGSSLDFGMAIGETESNYADCISLIEDLKDAAEGRFTVKVTRGEIGVDETMFWVGYVLPDIARLEDRAQMQEFRIAATDGLARLKGIEYKDDSGATDVPWGMLSFKDHLIQCLNQDGLSALYFGGTDVFLRTVVEWYEDGHGTPAVAKCPLAYSRVSGEVFAERDKDGGWKFKNCFQVLEEICRHWRARLYFSDGCYRFEQYNNRASENFHERRFATDKSLLSSATTTYEELINQTHSGTRLATGVYQWLPPMKQAVISYNHNTYKNYLSGTSYKWYKTSGSNAALTISNIGFDADSYIKVSGVLKLKVSSASTAPWRQVFAMYLDVGSYSLKRHSQAVQPFYLIQYDTPAEWQISSVRADISTDFIFSGSFEGQIPFTIWTPVIPSGQNSLSIDFDVYGAFNNVESTVTTTISDWAFQDLTLTIIGLDTAANYEAARKYYSDNSDTGNSFISEEAHIFGHAVKPWTPSKIQVTSDLATWADSTATWTVEGDGTSYEFGALAANETLAAQPKPVQTYNGSIRGDRMFAHYRFTTSGDSYVWLFLNGRFDAQTETMSGTWWNVGVDRLFTVNGPILQLPVGGHDPDTGGPQNPHSPGNNVPVNNGTNIALNALTNNFTSAIVSAGSVTSIPVAYQVKANAYEVGDEIVMVNPQTGKVSTLTITTNSALGDTSLAVSGTLDEDLPLGSFVIYSSLNKTTTEGGPSSPTNYWEEVTGGHIQNVNTGAVRTTDLLRIGSVSGITPTALIGRDGSGDVGAITLDSSLTLTAGVLAAVTGGSGTVTSVALSLPSIFSVSGSPVTTSGTLTGTLATQSANTIFAGPTSGGAATPAFRALVAADIPSLSGSAITGLTANQVLYGSGGGSIAQNAALTWNNFLTTKNNNASTSYGASTNQDGIRLQNTDTTDNNWAAISNYSPSGTIAGAIAFQNITAASHYSQFSVFTREAAAGFQRVLKVSSLESEFYYPVKLTGTVTIAGATTVNAAMTFNAGFTVNTVAPTFNTALTLGSSSVGSKLTVWNDYSSTSAAASAAFANILLRNRDSTTNNWSAIEWDAGGGAICADIAVQYVNQASNYGDIVFHTRGSGGYAEAFRVDSNKKVTTASLVLIGSVSGITPTTIIGRDGSGNVGTVSLGSGFSISSGTLNYTETGTGTVTSVALSLPSIFSVSGSPVTTSGTLTGTLATQSANTIFAGPTTGGAATPTFRALVAADVPNLDAAKITTGTFGIAQGGTGLSALGTANQMIRVNAGATALEYFTPTFTGTVTSVALSLPSIFSVSGSPVTTSGTLTGTLATQSANTIFAGPTTGAAATPTFRALVAADVPNLDAAKITTGTFGIAQGGTGLSALGTANQLIRVNAGATALEYFTPTYLTGNQTITLSGDVTGSGTTAITTTIASNAVTDAKFRQSAGLSVVGRSANTTGNVADITAASDFQVLRRSGTSIAFGSVNLASTNAVTGTLPVGNGGTGAATLASDSVLTGNGTSAITAEANLTFNSSGQLTVGSGTPAGIVNIFSGAVGVATEFIRMSGNVGSNMLLTMTNANNATTAANSIFNIAVGGASAGDPCIQFIISGVTQHAIGVDNSASDKFKITPGATVPGGTANHGIIVTNDATPLIGINIDNPVHPLDVSGRSRANQTVQVQENPTVVFGAGAGTGATGSCTGGSNGFQITFTTGTTPTAGGLIFTVTLVTAYPTAHSFVPGARNPQAATDLNKFYTSGFSASQISVSANGTLAASTQYVLYYVGTGY